MVTQPLSKYNGKEPAQICYLQKALSPLWAHELAAALLSCDKADALPTNPSYGSIRKKDNHSQLMQCAV